MKLVAILSGGDWTDAQCSHVWVPDDIDFVAVEREWRTWYHTLYIPTLDAKKHPRYISFEDMLKERHGAISALIEEYHRL